jgi:hypothetical protein
VVAGGVAGVISLGLAMGCWPAAISQRAKREIRPE